MRLRWVCAFLVLLACDPTLLPSHATPPTGQARRVSRAVHHTVAGDLSTARVAKAIEQRLADAAKARADTFVLELTGDRWRADVVRDIAGSIRSCGIRTVVWLSDRKGGTVGAGQAALGLIADECWIRPGTMIERRADEQDADLAPKGTNHPRIIEDLSVLCARNARDRATDPLLIGALLGESTPLWAVDEFDDDTLRLTPTEPKEGPDAPFHVVPLRPVDAPETLLARLDAPTAVALRFASGTAATLPEIFTQRNVSPSTGGALAVGGALAPILEKAASALDSLDRDIERLEAELRAKPRDKRVNTQDFYRELGERVLKDAQKTRQRLGAAEQLLADDPEIARTPPPGTTPVGVSADSCAARWRQTFQKRRDAIARLEKKARGFAGS